MKSPSKKSQDIAIGIVGRLKTGDPLTITTKERLSIWIEEAIDEQRERCAKVAEATTNSPDGRYYGDQLTAKSIAEAIRMEGE